MASLFEKPVPAVSRTVKITAASATAVDFQLAIAINDHTDQPALIVLGIASQTCSQRPMAFLASH
jgi:hypothetical protein